MNADAITQDQAWQLLVEAGVPLAPGHPREGSVDAAALARAAIIAGRDARTLSTQEREALYATLRAWRHHWPESFRRHLGDRGLALLGALEAASIDPDRYLKLRRIAIAHLARSL